jgi:hypothetical protein
MSSLKLICEPLPAFVVPKAPTQKKRREKEEVKATTQKPAQTTAKKPRKPIVDLSGKTTPVNIFKRQVQAVVCEQLAEKEVEVFADCLVLEQD